MKSPVVVAPGTLKAKVPPLPERPAPVKAAKPPCRFCQQTRGMVRKFFKGK